MINIKLYRPTWRKNLSSFRTRLFFICLGAFIFLMNPDYHQPILAASSVHCVALTSLPTSTPCANPITYVSIQEAINKASDGDEIRIAQGTYSSNQAYIITIVDKSLHLSGGYHTSNWQNTTSVGSTVIDGKGERRNILIFGSSSVTLEHLSIMNGFSTGSGGGVEANILGGYTVKLVDVIVSNNTSWFSGGGMFVVGGSTILNRTQILNNTTKEDGGGFYGLDLYASNSKIADNTATRYAGGVKALHARIEDTEISGNIASTGDGGGFYSDPSTLGATVNMTRTKIIDNYAAGIGGGMYLGNSDLTEIHWSLIANNKAGEIDSIALAPSTAARPDMHITNASIVQTNLSSHAAIGIPQGTGSPGITLHLNNTVIANHAVGIAQWGNVTLQGDHTAFFNNSINYVVNGVSISLPFTHLISSNPQFIKPASNDFHLQATSPLRDAGNPLLEYRNQYDLDGIPIPSGAQADIGAYEYKQAFYFTYLPRLLR